MRIRGLMTLEQLMAFTVTNDHERQEQVWEQLARSYNKEPYYIRRQLTEGAIRASDKRAQFVGVDAYEAAGGPVMRDLFQQDDGGWLQDPALLDRLVVEKLASEAEALRGEGWKWIEVAAEFRGQADLDLVAHAGTEGAPPHNDRTGPPGPGRRRGGASRSAAERLAQPLHLVHVLDGARHHRPDQLVRLLGGELAFLAARPPASLRLLARYQEGFRPGEAGQKIIAIHHKGRRPLLLEEGSNKIAPRRGASQTGQQDKCRFNR